MIPVKPRARQDKTSLWNYMRAFRRDILSAQPQRLYRAWMAEFRTPFFRSYMINQPDLIKTVLKTRPDDFPKSMRIAAGTAPDDLATKIMTTPDPETGHCFEWREMVDQVAIFFLAGHETSASALAWSLYLLAENQDVQARLALEVAEHDLDMAGLSKMTLLRGVFREALRLYPPVPMMVRETTCPEGFRDRTLPTGSQVVLSPWHLHRHERLWDDPDAFNPERYDSENGKTCLRDAFIPFSAGARVCPGAGFAILEGPLLIAAILRKYRVSMTDHGRPVQVAHLTVRAKNGIWLRFQSLD